jgi:hypothetical protein
MSQTLGPCIKDLCTADAVAYLYRTQGPSARLTVITGPRAAELADAIPESVEDVMCGDHTRQALDDFLASQERPQL